MTQIDAGDEASLAAAAVGLAVPGLKATRFVAPRFAAAAFRRSFVGALRHRQLAIAGALINTRHGCPGYFRFALGSGIPGHKTVIGLEFRRDNCILELNPHLSGERLEFICYRLLTLLPVLTACRDMPAGSIALNVDDYGIVPGLAFSDPRPDRWLIPDPVYLGEQAYLSTARHYLDNDVPWMQRRRLALWRGSTTGGEIDCLDWEMLDRVRLCRIGEANPDLFDTGLVGIVQMNEADTAAIEASGLVGNFVPETDFIRYRYQIDIDGNTNSWPGLFQKLLTGSPVLKVASRHGHRQWYYDRLVPWANFVPVESDMSDLVEKLHWLMANDDEARRIGANARVLALSMTMPAELDHAAATIRAALAANVVRP